MAESVTWMDPNSLREWSKNPKQHDTANVQTLARSLRRFGFVAPVVVWGSQKQIVAGHGRCRAALLILKADPGAYLAIDAPGPGLIPVRVVEFASASEADMYAIQDNRSTESNPMDPAAIAEILRELDAEGEEIEIPAYSDAEIEAMLGKEEPDGTGGTDEGAPEVQDGPPDSVVGGVYELGPHRLVCGDCGDKGVVGVLFADGRHPVATLTDPPYGQNQPGVTNDAPEDLRRIVSAALSANPMRNGVCVAFNSPRTFIEWLDAARSVGHKFERMLWMYKEAQNTYPWRGWLLTSEAILVSSIGAPEWSDYHPYKHDCYKLSEVSGELPDDIGWHGSVKPLSVIEDIVQRICPDGSVVYEPFGGSGTTLIACAKTGRVARLIEIDPRYCDVIRRRWTRYALSAGVDPGPGMLGA